VANDVDLRNFGHTVEVVVAAKFRRKDIVDRGFVNIKLRQTIAYAAGLRPLEDQSLIL
jgi:hypothetical protein